MATTDNQAEQTKQDAPPTILRGADHKPTPPTGERERWKPPTDGTTMQDLYRVRKNDPA